MERPTLTTRTAPPGVATPASAPPDATPLVIPVDAPAPGRARPAAPLRREGPAKLTGEAKYADDLVFPGAWFGATIRSTEPHARLEAIELDDAFDWKRVVVVTSADIPGENLVSLIQDDQPVLVPVGGEIRHQAEPCALIAAPDRATLRAARAHVKLRTERLPATFDPLESEHEFAHYTVERGDAAKAMEDATLVIEGTYRVGHQEQLYIENQAMIAVPREDGGVTVHGSLQCPYYIHKAMKRALNLGDELAVVVQAETGGGFGGKEEYPSMIALHAALLALKCHKPVRMIYDRHEDISATTKRHPAVVRSRWGVSGTGELVAQDIEVIMDGGAYCTLTPVVLSRGVLHAGGPYRCENVRITGSRDGHQYPTERRLPRLRRAADRVRGRDAGQPHRRRPRRQPARPAPPMGLPRGRHDADGPGSPRERGRDRRPRGRGGGIGLRPPRRPDARLPRGADRWRPRRLRASASRWPGMAPGSPGPARSSSHRSRASS